MMTKAEEKAVLQQIAELIESTGEGSYIGYAFAGCVELAEDNIENDFGISPNDWLEKIVELEKTNKELTELNTELENSLERERKNKLSAGTRTELIFNLQNQQNKLSRTQTEAAKNIVKYAENPGSVEFKTSVENHRKCTSEIQHLDEMIDELVIK